MFKRRVVLRGFAILLALATVLCLSGCAGEMGVTTDELLKPPRAKGEMYDIGQTLEQSVSGKYTLKYPTAGKYRSAYILTDLTGKGKENFALAFYSILNAENVATMHLNLMKRTGEEWLSISDISMAAIGVEKVEISDLDSDGVQEIAVGWNIYGGVDKKIMVYSLKGLTLTPRLQESYTDFICADLKGNGQNDLLLLRHNTEEMSAAVQLYSFAEAGVHASESCLLDGAVSAFSEPIFSKLAGGRPAVYIDSFKGNGMQTEIIFYQDGSLQAPMAANPQTVSPTYRDSTVACLDIDQDGCLDIPLAESVITLQVGNKTETISPLTRWCTYDGAAFSVACRAMMNYADGYYLEIPARWQEQVTIGMDLDTRQRIVYVWDMEKNTVRSELVRIRTVSEGEWDKANNGMAGYDEITRSEGLVYAAMFSSFAGKEAVAKEELLTLFHLIS